MSNLNKRTYQQPRIRRNEVPPPPPGYTRKRMESGKKKGNSFTGLIGTLIVISAFSLLFYTLLEGNSGKKSSGNSVKKNKVLPIESVKNTNKKEGAGLKISVAAPALKENIAIPEHKLVYVAEKGHLEARNIDDALRFGYSIIDLSDSFVPYIFTDGPSSPNRYRKTFINLSNDRTDENGRKLKNGEHNYVELFGIPPSMSVVSERFLRDESRECFKKLNYEYFKRAKFSVTYVSRRDLRKELAEIRLQVKKAGGKKALKKKKNKYLSKKYRLLAAKYEMVVEAQKRLKCEGLLEKYSPGNISYATIDAIRDFEHKHMIFGWGILAGDTRKGFGRTPLKNNWRTLKRVIRERIVHSLGIIEDGTVNRVKGFNDKWKDSSGKKIKVRNLISSFTEKLMQSMGIETPEKALKFFKEIQGKSFGKFRVAVKFPPLPEYYSEFKFDVEIDRGDVYYDAPDDASGKKRYQPVFRRPRIVLYTTFRGHKIPLIRWGTTIGGWRTEYKDGKEYFAYKGSDTGPRIWKDIFSAPVWIPPKSAPPGGLIKSERKNGRWITRVNTEEMGPSYKSAYGLVAAHHIRNRTDSGKAIWFDNGIRTHGSVDYMSIMRRHSHGCHRLHNHLAVRIFSFILMHSEHSRKGQTSLIYTRGFNYKNRDYKLKLDTRGYQFSLKKAIQVNVLPGRILGKLKEPYKGFLPKPGIKYSDDDPNLQNDIAPDDDKSGGGQQKVTEKEKRTEEKLSANEEKRTEEKIIKSRKNLPPPPIGVKPII
ncbi:MAG: hypothetical protein JXR95_06505 [Deltaproteobacteria bacterium]|nr:hypothetical protein [Deltaproteobacteria bacterium]